MDVPFHCLYRFCFCTRSSNDSTSFPDVIRYSRHEYLLIDYDQSLYVMEYSITHTEKSVQTHSEIHLNPKVVLQREIILQYFQMRCCAVLRGERRS